MGRLGTRGPGETKLEIDRRRIKKRISKLREDIEELEKTRATKRRERTRPHVPSVALVGYTNAGKSTLLNTLTQRGRAGRGQAVLDARPDDAPLELPDGRPCVLTDTVGFVRKLPHALVEAFKSTLEEAIRADLIVHLVDGCDAEPEGQYIAVRDVLGEIGAAAVPELVAVNKIDAVSEVDLARLRRRFPEAAFLSALEGRGVPRRCSSASRRRCRILRSRWIFSFPTTAATSLPRSTPPALCSWRNITRNGTRVRARLREDQVGRLASTSCLLKKSVRDEGRDSSQARRR